MASSDATAIPIKGQAYRVTFPIIDGTGDLVSSAAGLNSKVSKDGNAFANSTNSVVQIATNSGVYYLDLTSTEMNANTVAVIISTTTENAKSTTLIFYPASPGDIPVNVKQINGTNQTARDIGASVLLSPGTGSGQVSLSSGKVTVGTNDDKTGYGLSSTGVADIWKALTSGLTTANSIGKLLVDNIDAKITSRSTYAGADTAGTTTLLTRIGGTLNITSGKVDVNDKTGFSLAANQAGVTIGTVTNLTNLPSAPADWITANAVKADAVTKIQNGLATPTNITGGTITTVTNLTNAPTNGDLTTTMKASVTTAATASTPALSAAGVTAIVTAVWKAATSGLTTAGSIGKLLVDNIDAKITSRSTYAGADTAGTTTLLSRIGSAINISGGQVETNVKKFNGTNVTGRDIGASVLLSSGTGAGQISLSSGKVTVGTNDDKTDYSLTAAYDAAKTAASQTSVNNLGSPMQATSYVEPDNLGISAIKMQTDKMKFTATDIIKATLDGEKVTVVTNEDKTGYSLSSSGIQAIWNKLTSGLTTAGSIGKHIVDYLTGDIFTRLGAPSGASVSADIKAIGDNIGTEGANLKDIPWNTSWDTSVKGDLEEALGNYDAPTKDEMDLRFDEIPTAVDIRTEMENPVGYLASIKEIQDKESTMIEQDGATWKFTQKALDNAPTIKDSQMDMIAGKILDSEIDDHKLPGTIGYALLLASSLGPGYKDLTYTLKRVDNGLPISGAVVWVSTDIERKNVIRSGITDSFGIVKFQNLDLGTYYVWSKVDRYNVDAPDIEVVE